jgi:hypothetical protein
MNDLINTEDSMTIIQDPADIIQEKRRHINEINKKNYYLRSQQNRNKQLIPSTQQRQRGRKPKEITEADILKLTLRSEIKKPRGRPPKKAVN